MRTSGRLKVEVLSFYFGGERKRRNRNGGGVKKEKKSVKKEETGMLRSFSSFFTVAEHIFTSSGGS